MISGYYKSGYWFITAEIGHDDVISADTP